MNKVKSIVDKISYLVQKKPKEFLALGVFVMAISIYFIGSAFALLTPVQSIIITSEKTSYENKKPGSWQVEKSSKCIRKGVARVTFDVDTTLMTEDKSTDIIMVLDISSSMNGEKLNRVKEDSIELIDSVLSNQNNKMALITFETNSTIVSDFTNNKNELINQINNLEDVGSTNYYQALVNVDEILKDYIKQDNREVIVLFLTDGYPNVDIPNQIGEYQYLKKAYPYLTVNGIQYEMGNNILKQVKEISDHQFHADIETLNNVLFNASTIPIPYDEFKIIDYIDNNYFTLKSEDDITVSEGSVKLEEEDGKQKITWTIPSLKSGRDAKLTMDIALKDEYIGQGGVYPTNESEEIISKIVNNPDEDVKSTKTPILSDSYQVIYDGNAPDGCSVSNLESDTNYSVFDTVSITTKKPNCTGYEFKGWEVITKDVTRVGEDYFIMPEKYVVIRAKWSKLDLAKSMEGTVSTMGDPIMKGKSWWSSKYNKSDVTSIEIKNQIYISDSGIYSWDVSEAGDGSVIAYIEDDGTDNGTYKVIIGGRGNVIANVNSSGLFSDFTNMKSIMLTYFDTSNIESMNTMFYNCGSLLSLDLNNFDTSNVTTMARVFDSCFELRYLDIENFNTSKVTDMWGMFWQCKNLISINLKSFDTSKVTNMIGMFYNCGGLASLDVSNFDTTNVISVKNMFYNCSSLTSLDVSSFNTSNVADMGSMFRGCGSLTGLDVGNFDTKKVASMRTMFSDCRSLTSIDISNFDTSKVTDMSGMFQYCESLTSLDMRNADFSSVTSYGSMFRSVNSNIDVIVKDSKAESFVRARLDDDGRPNATVTIASAI